MKATLLAIALLVEGSPAAPSAGSSAELEARLQHRLMAPCCYGGTLDQHNSDVANRMKAHIHELVMAGRSERQILDYYKARFGMRILAEPEGLTWWFGTLTPLVALIAGAFAVTRLIRKWARPAEANRPV